MSTDVMTIVFRRKFGDARKKCLALRLADHASADGRGIYPGNKRLAAESDLSVRTVQAYLAEFVESGLLIVVDEGGRGPKSTRRYDMNLEVLEAMPLARPPENKGAGTAPIGENMGAGAAPLEPAKGAGDDTLGCGGCTQTLIEPNIPLTPQGAAERTGPPYDGGGPTDRPADVSPFDAAFALWPGYLTEERGPAWHQWAQLSLADRQRARRYIPTFLQIWAKNQGRKRVYPFAKYLVERPWERAQAGPDIAGKRVFLKAFSREWLLRRFELLLAGPGNFDDRDPRHWRAVKDFDSLSRHGFSSAPPGWQPPAVDMEPVPVGSDVFEAWRDAFKAAGWLWFPDPGKLPVVHFPAGGPPSVGITSDFVALLSGPAAQAEAREHSDA